MYHPPTEAQQMRLSVAERLEPQLQLAQRQNQRYREQLKVLARQNRAMSLVLSRIKAQQVAVGEDGQHQEPDLLRFFDSTIDEERQRRDTHRQLHPATAELHKIYATGAEVRAATAIGGGYHSEFAALEAANAASAGGPSLPPRTHRQAPRVPGRKPGGGGGAGSTAAAGSGVAAAREEQRERSAFIMS